MALAILVVTCAWMSFTYYDRFVVQEEGGVEQQRGDGKPEPTAKQTTQAKHTKEKWVYEYAPNLVAQGDNGYKLIYANTVPTCEKACTADKDCTAYTFDGMSKECMILNAVDKLQINTSKQGQGRSAFKRRPSLEDPSYKEHASTGFPDNSIGNIATVPKIGTVFECGRMCDGSVRQGQAPCIAFEYNHADEVCKLNSSVMGKLQANVEDKTVGVKLT